MNFIFQVCLNYILMIIEEIKNCYLMSDLKALSIQSKDCLTKYISYLYSKLDKLVVRIYKFI